MSDYYPVNPNGYGPIAPVLLSHWLTAQWCLSDLAPEERLSQLLADKVMRFNPYVVDDHTLLECAARARFLPLPSLTQMVIFHFLDIRKVFHNFSYEAIFYRIGNCPETFHISVPSLTNSISHYYTKQSIHSRFNKAILTNFSMVEKMQNRSFFISNFIPGCRPNQSFNMAFRFHRLKGDEHSQADTIRRSMCAAKIEMINEVLTYPWSECHLKARPITFDYRTPLLHAIQIINNFPSYPGHLPGLSNLY